MKNNTPYALLISIAALFMVGVSFFFGGGASDTDVLMQLNAVKAQVEAQHAGALGGPEVSSPYLQWGGINHWAFGNASPVATTTSGVFCSLAVPYGTSTVDRIAWRPDNLAFGTGQTFDVSTSTVLSGSSTPALLFSASLSVAQVWTPEASTTSANPSQVLSFSNTTGSGNVFLVVSSPTAPSYLNFRVATGTPGTFATYLAGNCSAEFTQI